MLANKLSSGSHSSLCVKTLPELGYKVAENLDKALNRTQLQDLHSPLEMGSNHNIRRKLPTNQNFVASYSFKVTILTNMSC